MKAQVRLGVLLIVVGAGLLGLIVIFGGSNFLMSELNSEIQSGDDYDNNTQSVMQKVTDRNYKVLDNAFIFLFGVLVIASFFAGLTTQRNPIALIIVILLLFGSVWLGMTINNTYEDLASDMTDDIDFSTYFPKAHWVMSNLVISLIMVGFSFGLGMVMSNQV